MIFTMAYSHLDTMPLSAGTVTVLFLTLKIDVICRHSNIYIQQAQSEYCSSFTANKLRVLIKNLSCSVLWPSPLQFLLTLNIHIVDYIFY